MIGRRTGHASSGEREQTLDQLLAEMDGFANDPSKPVVVLAHMSNGSLCEWLPEARRLAARGIWVFAFDFRGQQI